MVVNFCFFFFLQCAGMQMTLKVTYFINICLKIVLYNFKHHEVYLKMMLCQDVQTLRSWKKLKGINEDNKVWKRFSRIQTCKKF